jgi:hypothetical protein
VKTISEETAHLLEIAFHRAAEAIPLPDQVSKEDVRTHGWVTHMGRQFYATLKEVRRPSRHTTWYQTVSRHYTIEPVDREWRLTRHIFGNLCGEVPIHVMFVGDRAAFERDMAMLKMLVHKPVGDVRMAV